MDAQQIREAIDQGKQVFWGTSGYPVIKDNKGQYLITCTTTSMCIGLTWQDGVTLNGKEEEFFIHEED